VPQKPSISSIAGGVPIASIHQRKNAAVPAIGILQQHGSIVLVRVLRTECDEVRGKLHFAMLHVYSILEIHDAAVVWIGYRNRKVNAASQSLVGSRRTERCTVKNVSPRSNFHANDAAIDGRCAAKK